jgi:chromosome segregation ATPase
MKNSNSMEKKFYELFKSLDGLDAKSVGYLSAAIEKNNLKGFDYFEFRKSVSAMEGMLEQEMAIKSAYTTAMNMGLTKEKLLHSIDHYKNVLSKEKRQFDDALKSQIAQKINSKRDEKLQLKEHISNLKKNITELQKKISAYQERIDNSDAEVAAAEQKINETKANFEEAYGKFVSEINDDYKLIDSIL